MQSDMSELSGWPTIAEAAAQLGTTPRSIERRIAAGEIESRKRPRKMRKPETVCNPRDIERLQPPAFAMPASANGAGQLVRAGERIQPPPALDVLAAAMATIAAGQRDTAAVITPKRWLTIPEASSASGLSERLLWRHRRELGVKDGRPWKIDRQKLETFQPGRTA